MTSLNIEWDALTGGDIDVDGYMLYMGVKGSGSFDLIYDGSSNAENLSYNVNNLQTG